MKASRRIALAVLVGAAFLALAGLVWAGALSGLDNHAIHHWMPWAQPPGRHELVHLRAVFLPETRSTLGGTLVGLWTYPASPFISLVVVLLCARFLERRAAVAVVALWVVANAIELTGKLTITRPSIDVANLRDSFPSGHTVRALVLAAVLAWTWRRAGAPALAWGADGAARARRAGRPRSNGRDRRGAAGRVPDPAGAVSAFPDGYVILRT